jgi:hypothetical protein
MKRYNEIKAGDLFIIPKGTEFWSIALQETVIGTRDIVIKITNTCVPENNYVFGNIQIVIHNHELAAFIGIEKAKSFLNTKNGDIGIGYSTLIEYNKNNKIVANDNNNN